MDATYLNLRHFEESRCTYASRKPHLPPESVSRISAEFKHTFTFDCVNIMGEGHNGGEPIMIQSEQEQEVLAPRPSA